MSIEAINWALNADIKNPGAKLVLIVLANYADEHGHCWPSQKTISQKTSISERSIRSHLTWLENQLFIKRAHRDTNKRNQYTSDIYTLRVNSQRQILPTANSAHGKKTQRQRQISPPNLLKETTNKNPSCPKNKFSDADQKLAHDFFNKILGVSPEAKPPNFDKWANSIRLMRERDNRTREEIYELFLWANDDPFWQSNILSPDSLRKHWDKLSIKRRQGNDHEHRRSKSGADYIANICAKNAFDEG